MKNPKSQITNKSKYLNSKFVCNLALEIWDLLK